MENIPKDSIKVELSIGKKKQSVWVEKDCPLEDYPGVVALLIEDVLTRDLSEEITKMLNKSGK